MLFQSNFFVAVVTAFLLASGSIAAVVHRSVDQDDITSQHDIRSESYNGTLVGLEARRGGGGAAGDIISGITSIITAIQDGINKDKEARSKFTYNLVSQMHSKHPNFNWIVCHTKHDYKFDGKRGVDWDHRHQEFDIKIGGTIGYEIYNLKTGDFTRKGDGGYLNWAYIGNIAKTDNGGKHIVFGKP